MVRTLSRQPAQLMDNLQFVIEAPQDGPGRKKRARLVTSCDNCRSKKIRCIPSTNSNKCEACATAHVACQFRDREQYFEERSRIMSGTSSQGQHGGGVSSAPGSFSILDTHGQLSGTPPPPSHQTGRISGGNTSSGYPSHQAVSSFSTHGTSTHGASQMIWSSAALQQSSARPHHGYSSSSGPFNAMSGTSSNQATPQSTRMPLFDPERRSSPHMTLMTHYVPAYFDHYGHFFLFVVYDETIRKFLDKTLSPLIGNCIAALAAWHVEIPEVTQRGAANVSDAYITQANTLLSQAGQSNPVESLHALILLAWAEYKRARAPSYFDYVQRAYQMAQQLGLANGTLIQRARSEHERTVLRSTWDIVQQLSMSIASVGPGPGMAS